MCNIILKLIKIVDYQLLSLQMVSIDAWWSIHWTLTHDDSETLITFFTQISTTISIHDIVRMMIWSSTVSIKQLHVHSHCNATEHDEQFTVVVNSRNRDDSNRAHCSVSRSCDEDASIIKLNESCEKSKTAFVIIVVFEHHYWLLIIKSMLIAVDQTEWCINVRIMHRC